MDSSRSYIKKLQSQKLLIVTRNSWWKARERMLQHVVWRLRTRMCIESLRLEREEEKEAPTYTEVHVRDSHRILRVAIGADKSYA